MFNKCVNEKTEIILFFIWLRWKMHVKATRISLTIRLCDESTSIGNSNQISGLVHGSSRLQMYDTDMQVSEKLLLVDLYNRVVD